MAERVNIKDFEPKVLGNPRLAVVEFYSDSCLPCKKMAPVLTQLEDLYPDAIYVAKVNVLFDGELVEKYDVLSSPTFLFFKDGLVVERFSGTKTKDEFIQLIEKHRGNK